VVDPPDGKIPPLTPEGAAGGGSPHGATASYRYNSNYQILQSPGYVTILIEMIHDVPIIPHISQDIRRWLGDSLGHW